MGKHVHRVTLDDLKHELKLYRRYRVNQWRYFTKPKLLAWLDKLTKRH